MSLQDQLWTSIAYGHRHRKAEFVADQDELRREQNRLRQELDRVSPEQVIELDRAIVLLNVRGLRWFDEGIDEFIALSLEEDGVRPSREVAAEAAARVVRLYERLLMPTPREIEEARLANSRARGTVPTRLVQPPETNPTTS